jgi:hypothetical protein
MHMVRMVRMVCIVQNCAYGAYGICDDLKWSSKHESKHLFTNVV